MQFEHSVMRLPFKLAHGIPVHDFIEILFLQILGNPNLSNCQNVVILFLVVARSILLN